MTGAMPVNFREVLERALAGDASAPPEFDTFARNAREVARRRDREVAEVLHEFGTELRTLLDRYRSISDDDWLRPAWFFVGPVNVRTLFLVQLSDNVFHERDLLLPAGRWSGLDADAVRPLVDWFLREYRPAGFRPGKAGSLRATLLYRLGGAGAGEWTYHVADGGCRVERGAVGSPDAIVEADTEELIVAGLGRAAPAVGALSRALTLPLGGPGAETVVAAATGGASLASAVARRRIRVHGDRKAFARVQRCFWHFWQRRRQTQENIALDHRARVN
jgi:hypothetical protein